jgi:methionine synthase I (cobalamin-dependent)
MTERKHTNRKYLDALEKKVLVFDGAMGTSLQVQDLTAEHFGGGGFENLNLNSPASDSVIPVLSSPSENRRVHPIPST